MLFTATNLNPPYYAAAFDAQDPTSKWRVEVSDLSTVRVETSTHRFSNNGAALDGTVEVLIGEINSLSTNFSLSGYTLDGKQVWNTVTQLDPSQVLDINYARLFTISDDASLAAYIVIDFTLEETVWSILDASTGSQLWNVSQAQATSAFLQFSQDNTILFWASEANIYSFDAKNGKPHAPRVSMPAQPINPWTYMAYKNGKHDYIVAGYGSLQVHTYDESSQAYSMLWQDESGHPQMVLSAVAITEVEGTVYFAVSWDVQGYTHVVIELRTIDNATPLWTYVSPSSDGEVQDTVSEMVFDPSGYLAVSTWGDMNHQTPQVLLFHIKSSTPVWSTTTPGSMQSIDLCYDGEEVWISSAGKHVHDNQEGLGGDFYSWSVLP